MDNTIERIPEFQRNPITMKESVLFGLGGGVGSNILNMIVASFAVYFMTDVAGLSVGSAGLVFAITTIIDAVTDPMIGAICDRTVTDKGRFRPFMIFGAFACAIGTIWLFSCPPLADGFKFIYYLLAYIAMKVGETFFMVPYHSAPTIMSSEKPVRNRLVMLGKVFAAPVGLITSYTHQLVAKLGSQSSESSGWFRLVLCFSVIFIAAVFLCQWTMKRFDNREIALEATKNRQGERASFRDIFSSVKGNKAVFFLLLAYTTNCFADRCLTTNQSYYAKYILGNMKFISTAGTIGSISAIPMFLIIFFLTRKISKRNIFMIITFLHVVFPVAILLGQGYNYGLMVALYTITKMLSYGCNILMFMMIPDCVDYGYTLTGVVSAGLISAFIAFVDKLAIALGTTLSTSVLDVAGYTANEVQSAAVITAIFILMSIPTLISDICSVIGMWFYPVKAIDGVLKKS